MKKTTLACALVSPLLVSPHSAALAATEYQSALSNCRNEAISTGLENEDDIKYYVDLCMQSFGGIAADAGAEHPETMQETTGEDPGVDTR
ncbi:MAG: hypothetical protein J5I92_14470 [Thiogranum sp.]|nr:hypothetical protein [Thiogranum sp.]